MFFIHTSFSRLALVASETIYIFFKGIFSPVLTRNLKLKFRSNRPIASISPHTRNAERKWFALKQQLIANKQLTKHITRRYFLLHFELERKKKTDKILPLMFWMTDYFVLS